ncbi:MAG: PadR family transcriptional regulator [Actinomycetota bacterium]
MPADTPLREPTFFVLTALASGPAHGYGIIQAVEEMSEGRVKLRAGTLYGALDRLERDGLVAFEGTGSEGGPPRRYYGLTDEGRAVLAREVERLVANASLARSRLGPASA